MVTMRRKNLMILPFGPCSELARQNGGGQLCKRTAVLWDIVHYPVGATRFNLGYQRIGILNTEDDEKKSDPYSLLLPTTSSLSDGSSSGLEHSFKVLLVQRDAENESRC